MWVSEQGPVYAGIAAGRSIIPDDLTFVAKGLPRAAIAGTIRPKSWYVSCAVPGGSKWGEPRRIDFELPGKMPGGQAILFARDFPSRSDRRRGSTLRLPA